ncbi:MAG: hypothetical protein EPO26_14285 [Chloroflexota bacterium]|nr:MAG: hypothetical protein EPO26_14285 [Chloroflexota bacterium]
MASINVDFSVGQGAISSRLYGAGLEHVGASVYGGFWTGPARPGDESRSAPPVHIGWREDVLTLARALRPGILRWPGGPFSQSYRWRDGVGPRGDRPLRFDHYWAKPEPNHVGTDEFLDLCRWIDAEPAITVNTRSARPEEAAAWVEYCNGSMLTSAGALRLANGQPNPWNARLWSVGSNNWDMGAPEAARRHNLFARAMRGVDPGIELTAIGGNPSNQSEWDKVVIGQTAEQFRHLGVWAFDGVASVEGDNPEDLFHAHVASAERILWTISNAAYRLDEMMLNGGAYVGVDGWGIWKQSRQGLQHDYDMSDALIAATVLHGLHRLAPRVGYAAWGNLVNALGLIQATERACWATPVYHIMKMFRDLHGTEATRCTVAGPAVAAPGGNSPVRSSRPPYKGMALIDASASRDVARGRYTLSVVNRSFSDRHDVEIDVKGLPTGIGATSHLLRAESPFAANSAKEPRAIEPFVFPIGQIPREYPFPAHSVTVLIWEETPGLT